MLQVGVIGYGYWGPNIVRNFESVEGTSVLSVCDTNPDMLKRAKKAFPNIALTSDASEIISSHDINVVAVVTPVSTHFDLAKKALLNGKHVFVEKPFTATVAEAEELIEIAERKQLKIMVDHTFIFTSAVQKIKQCIEDGILGNLYYFDSMRVNLGLFQHDVNVVWDLAPHDLSIMNYLIKERPQGIVATGESHFNNGLEDVAYITVYFSNNIIAHLNVNWLSPVKIRTTLIGGQKKMLVWNDLEPDNRIKIYDKGVEVGTRNGIFNLLVSYRSGDMWAPNLEPVEALRLEVECFVDCILNGTVPLNDGIAGLKVVQMLEAANKSLKNKGEYVPM